MLFITFLAFEFIRGRRWLEERMVVGGGEVVSGLDGWTRKKSTGTVKDGVSDFRKNRRR